MAALDPSRAPDKRLLGYRFAGVVLDLRRQTLIVDAAEVAATPLMLRLMQILCEADGQLLKRQDLFDRLWPGGQEISDSSLSQLVWRLRGALGPYAECVATVRRSGLRLDAAVTPEFDFQRTARRSPTDDEGEVPRTLRLLDLSAPSADTANDRIDIGTPARDAADASEAEARPSADANSAAIATPRQEPATMPRRRRSARPALGLLLAAVVAALVYALWPRDALISPGYGLRASDLQASRPDTPRLAAAAFQAAYDGEFSHAEALMRSLHASDPSTPVPAMLLGYWVSDADADASAQWLAAARQRLGPTSSPYLRLMADYLAARARSQPVRGPLNALLDLRPEAWFLQYARAHDQLANREFAGALRSLQQIPLDIPDATRLAEVLTDRVSLGDRAAETLTLQQPAVEKDAVFAPYVRARLAYSRGDLDAAVQAFDRSAAAAQEQRRYAWQRESTELGTLAAVEAGRADARRRTDAAARVCHEQEALGCEAEMLGLRAFLEARAGERDQAEASLREAWQRNPHAYVRAPLLLLALENALAAPGDVAAVAAEQPADAVFGGVAEVLQAWQSWSRGDTARAKQQLALARERGIAHSYHAEDAALLGARLGETAQPCRVDPPYPNALRLSACIALRPPTQAAPDRLPASH